VVWGPSRRALPRSLAGALVGGWVVLQGWLSVHSVFQVYGQLNREHGRAR
jgi:hypothetical protein